jgi:hypothetical protein
MIKEVKMYTVTCDICGKEAFAEGEYSCWNEPVFAEEMAEEDGWYCKDNVHYCPDCYTIDDDDNLIIKP